MTKKLKAFAIGMAGAFDLSGSVFHSHYFSTLSRANTRHNRLQRLRRKIRKNSTARLTPQEAMRYDLEKVGEDFNKVLNRV